MKTSQKIISILIIFILLLSIYFLLFYNKGIEHTTKLSNELSLELKQQQQQSIQNIQYSWKDDSLFTLVNAINGTEDEYTSYYFHQSALLLNQPTDNNYCKTITKKLEEESFARDITDNMIFTGIERVYRAYQSIQNCKTDAIPLLKKHTQYLLKESFYKNGFFLSEEFKEFKNNPDYQDVKLQHTYMMLALLSNLNLIEKVNKHKINMWVDNIKPKDFVTLETLLGIYGFLGIDKKFNLNNEIIRKRITKKTLDFDDLLEINSYVNIHKSNMLKADKQLLKSISNKIKYLSIEVSDIQSEYFKLNILRNLNVTINSKEKDAFLNKYSTFEYNNGMFPTITPFNNAFTPILIGKDLSQFSNDQTKKINTIIRKHIAKVTLDDLLKLDPLEIYSYLALLDLTGAQHPDNQLSMQLKKYLIKKTRESINVQNVMNWSFYTRSLLILEKDFNKDFLPVNTEDKINKITKYPGNYFNEENKITSLIFLDTLARTNLYSTELKKLESDIRNVSINTSLDIAAYLIYYKVSLMEKLDIQYDKNEIADQITVLYKNTGYTLNEKQNFPDMYSTYLITSVNKMVMGEKNE